MTFWAHSGTLEDRSDWEPLHEHLLDVARLARQLASPLGLPRTAFVAGQWHDLGKFNPAFQSRIAGQNLRVDHSTAGGAHLLAEAQGRDLPARLAAELLAYAILGHHAGLPDMLSGDGAGFQHRIEGYRDALAAEWREIGPIDFAGLGEEVMGKVRGGDSLRGPFDLSLAGRMLFSCLVDADFKATEHFYARNSGTAPDREWPSLQLHLEAHIAALDRRLASLPQDGPVNAIRRRVMGHVRDRAAMSPGPFTLTVPTGGGKTLASLGFALEHARRHGHRRIIYVIPFTSIIDQTAAQFRDLLGDEHVLEHHASIERAEGGDETLQSSDHKMRLAMEDWAAPVVVTTAVQFFESLFAARTSRARKLHNIAGSVVVLDEAQTLPRGLLAPCLRMLDSLCTHYGVSVVLCTATQPALNEKLVGKQRVGSRQVDAVLGLPLSGRELAPEPDRLNAELRRTIIRDGGTMNDAAVVAALDASIQSLVVVNSRRHALDLYRAAQGLDGLIHLTTRQHAADRMRIIADIKDRLARGQPCRVIATSLIEAGVDLSFRRAWRARAGLDQIIQVAGRVNRNGEYPINESILTVFDPADHSPPPEIAGLASDLAAIMAAYPDLQDNAAIEAYFRQVYWRRQAGPEGLDSANVLARLSLLHGAERITDFSYRSIAADFRMIEDGLAPVIVAPDRAALEGRLRGNESSGKIAREMQRFIVQVPPRSRAGMVTAGAVRFAAPEQRGDQFAILVRDDLYSPREGLEWEGVEKLPVSATIY